MDWASSELSAPWQNANVLSPAAIYGFVPAVTTMLSCCGSGPTIQSRGKIRLIQQRSPGMITKLGFAKNWRRVTVGFGFWRWVICWPARFATTDLTTKRRQLALASRRDFAVYSWPLNYSQPPWTWPR